MAVAVRVIPCLDVDAGRVVKGVNFQNLRDAGDPVEMAAVYDAEGADELTFLDVTASSGGRETMMDVVRRTAEQVFIPLTVGGGIRTSDDVDRLLRAGADKVSINTAAIVRPELLGEMARRFGSQCIVLSVDARTVPAEAQPTPSGWEVTTHGGRRGTGIDAVEWAARGEELGVGEILLNSMDADGTRAGLRPQDDRGGARGRRRSGDRQRGRGRGRPLRRPRCVRERTPCSRPASSTSAACGSGRSRTRCAAREWRCGDEGRFGARPGDRGAPQADAGRPGVRRRPGARHPGGADGRLDGRRGAAPHADHRPGHLLVAQPRERTG